MPVNVFISYLHADEKALERLHKHLAMLRRGNYSARFQATQDDSAETGLRRCAVECGYK